MSAIIDQIHQSSFYEFAAILTLAALMGYVASALRQPLIIAFIALGLLAGPSAFGIVSSGDEMALLSKLGISILLFIVGLKLDLKLMASLGRVAVLIGIGQMALSFVLGLATALAFGFDVQSASMIAIALTFSSTIIIVKVLSDKREIDSLHGRIALGVLIIQDLAVVVSMMVLATIAGSGEAGLSFEALLTELGRIGAFMVGLIAFIALFMRYAAEKVVASMAKLPELLLCFAIAWAVCLAALCDSVGLSKELGGLLAGVSLASTPFREAIISRLAPLRDFLLLFFFVSLGTQIDIQALGSQVMAAIALSLFVLISKPLIIMALSGAMGYRKRTGFLAGLSLAQISEFSLIFIAMAHGLNLITDDVLALVTLVGLITIAISTYQLSVSHSLYRFFEPLLSVFERKNCPHSQPDDTEEEAASMSKAGYDMIVFGLGRYGELIVKKLLDKGHTVLAIDFNPEEVKRWRSLGHAAIYGDACDPEFYHALNLKKTAWVISALPQRHMGITHQDPRKVIVRSLKDQNFKGKIAIACHNEDVAKEFETLGTDLIFLPFHDAAERAVNLLHEFKR